MIERDSHKKKVSEKKAKHWRAKKRLTARDAELKELTTSQPTKEGSGPIRMGSTYEDNVERREADHHDAKKELKNLGGCGCGVVQPLAVAPCTRWLGPPEPLLSEKPGATVGVDIVHVRVHVKRRHRRLCPVCICVQKLQRL